MPTHSSILAWRIPGTGELVGCRLRGCTESDKTEATQQQQQQAKVCTSCCPFFLALITSWPICPCVLTPMANPGYLVPGMLMTSSLVLLFYNLVILIDTSIFSSMVAFVTVKLDLQMIFMKIFRDASDLLHQGIPQGLNERCFLCSSQET